MDGVRGGAARRELDEGWERAGRLFPAATVPFAAGHIVTGLATSSGWRVTGGAVVVLAVLALLSLVADLRGVRPARWVVVLLMTVSGVLGGVLALVAGDEP